MNSDDDHNTNSTVVVARKKTNNHAINSNKSARRTQARSKSKTRTCIYACLSNCFSQQCLFRLTASLFFVTWTGVFVYGWYSLYTPEEYLLRGNNHQHLLLRTRMVQKFDPPQTKEQEVINTIQRAWRGFSNYAMGADELMPLSKRGRNNWGHLQWTLVDALDTMYLAGLQDELEDARAQLKRSSFRSNAMVNTFEVTIRILGGTLSMHSLTGDQLYLDKAKDIGYRIMAAFGTPSGMPTKKFHLIFGHPNWLNNFKVRTNSLVGIGSVQLEMCHLSFVTGDQSFCKAAKGAIEAVRKEKRRNSSSDETKLMGLYPIQYNVDTGKVAGSPRYFTMSGGGDSFYEYLLKLYILEGGTDHQLLLDYTKAMDDMIKYMLRDFTIIDFAGSGKTVQAKVITHYPSSGLGSSMEHLACFVPGMLALGAWYGKQNNIPELLVRYEQHMQVAEQLVLTCAHFYFSQPSGLSAETYTWSSLTSDGLKASVRNKFYILRPETVESLYV